MDLHTITGIGLCAGVGWLDIAVRLAWERLGYRYRTLAFVERDAYAASVLVARMGESSLEQAAICDSIKDIDQRWAGRVDCAVAGFPCQDLSCAGRQDGIHGERSGLFFDILDAADRIGVQWLFLENVAAITSGDFAGREMDDEPEGDPRALSHVLRALAESGFDAEWMCLKASDVGASHQRDRWFCVAHRNQLGRQRLKRLRNGERTAQRNDTDGCDQAMAHRDGTRPGKQGQAEARQPKQQQGRPVEFGRRDGYLADAGIRNDAERSGEKLGDTWSPHERGCITEQQPRIRPAGAGESVGNSISPRRQGSGPGTQGECWARTGPASGMRGRIFAPGPADPAWPLILQEYPHLAPAIEPGVCLLADGSTLVLDESRADQLRCSGNGVVVLQAAAAFVELIRRSELV